MGRKSKMSESEKRIAARLASKKWREANKDKVRANMKKWREANREKINEYARKYYAEHKRKMHSYSKRYRNKNKESLRDYSAKYFKQNPEISCLRTARSVCKKFGLTDAVIAITQKIELVKKAKTKFNNAISKELA